MLYKDIKIEEVIKSLKTDENQGLSSVEVEKRLKEYGLNEITEKKKFSTLKLFLKQFYDFLTLLLIVSTIIAFFAGKIPTAIAIGIIILINIPLGFWMEYKSEKELEALKDMLKSQARVIRDGVEQLIDFSLIVPGDIIIIEEGQKIPADARLIKENNLRVNEASLTGESIPVEKDIIEIKGKDNANLVFLGTIAMTGSAKAVVVATGKNTEFGKIAQSLVEIKKPLTPLQKQVTQLGKAISFFGLIMALFILMLMHLQGLVFWDPEQLKLALSIFVSIMPSGLPLVMTLVLAIGVKKMATEKVIVKQLSSVETLGSTQIICTDKTGTLTENKMVVKKVWLSNGQFINIDDAIINKVKSGSDLEHLIRSGVICNSADVSQNKDGTWNILGDPTEASLLVLGEKFGFKEQEVKKGGIVFDFPFEQKLRRRMAVFENLETKETTLISIGAPENVLQVCSYYFNNGKEEKMDFVGDKNHRNLIEKNLLSLATEGYRVIGLASKKIDKTEKYDRIKLEKELIFIGLVALYDPPRSEVKQAIQECRDAGIRIVMITGDNPITALAIAKEINLTDREKRVIIGADIEKMNDDQLLKVVNNYDIFARTTPLHKLRIVKAFQRLGLVVAVTGDGVNDAPALKEADVGAAMGIRGTDVSKEASDLIVVDDNFSSIAKAVKRGRRIYANIKKFIQFLFTANLIEFPLILTSILTGMPMPITALQILWINFVTDSMPALTLGVEPGTGDIMKKKPRPPKEHILKGSLSFILFASFLGYIFALALFYYLYFILSSNLIFAQTMTFTFIVIYKLFLVFSTRANTKTIFELGFFTNKPMIGAVLFSFALQLTIIYVTFLHYIFGTTTLTLYNWILIFILSIFAVILIELKKVLFRN